MKKYLDLLKLTEKLYDDEIKRFRGIDEKASKYITVYSVLLVAEGILISIISTNKIIPFSPLFFVVLSPLIISIILILIALLLLSFSLKVEELQRIQYDSNMIDFFDDNMRLDIVYALSKRYTEATINNTEKGNKKTKNITSAHKLFLPSVFLIFLGVLFIITYSFLCPKITSSKLQNSKSIILPISYNEGSLMKKTKDKSKPSNKKNKPNPNIQAPMNVRISNDITCDLINKEK